MNRELARLYAARIEHRESATDQTLIAATRRRTMEIERAIHDAEKRFGRAGFAFKRCTICALLHPAALTGCDGKGEMLFAVWLRLSVDIVHVID